MSVSLCERRIRGTACDVYPPMGDHTARDDHHYDLPGGAYNLRLASHLREHLLHMRLRGRRERTLHCRRRVVVLLAEHLGHDPLTATYDELIAWQLHRMDVSLQTVAWETNVVRPYFRYLIEFGHRADNPAARLPVPSTRQGLPRPMAEPKVMTAVATARPRELPWLLLAGWCGMRASEVACLDVADFTRDAEGQVWAHVVGKGGRERNVPVPEWVWAIIAPTLPETGPCWRRQRGIGQVTGKQVSQACNAHLRAVGIPDTLHSLRHRVGTVTYQNTRDLRLVQDLLGHASPRTTAIYTRVAPAVVAAAVNALPPPPNTPRGARHLHAVPATHGGTG